MRRITIIATLLAVLAATSVAVSGAPAAPVARAAKTCSLKGYYGSLGASYVYRLSVKNISCRAGRSNVKAYNACRRRHGGARGRCSSVRGYSCSETRRSSRFQFDASASCHDGSRRFSFGYTQNT